MENEKLIDIWGRRNPEFERRYEDNIFKAFTDYGKGSSNYQEARGKIWGAGYEIYIIAFFIGLYSNRRVPLIKDTSKRMVLGHPIQNWGNRETRGQRKQYSKIRDYIFMALIARSEVDLIALDQAKFEPKTIIDTLIDTMEEYANFGFSFIEDKLSDTPDYFYRASGFLDIFLSFNEKPKRPRIMADDNPDDDVESLD